MLILKIKQAECALSDGRLDEAYEIARLPEVRAHRHGQKLIGRLADALISRGGAHLSDGLPREALADCSKAERLAGNTAALARLRADAIAAIDAAASTDRRKHHTLAEAERHLRRGELSLAGHVAATLDDSHARRLQDRIEQQRGLADKELHRAAAAMDADDLILAIDHLQRARQCGASSDACEPMTSKVMRKAIDLARAGLCEGRLDYSAAILERAARLRGDDFELRELRQMLGDCQRARRNLAQRRFRPLIAVLARLKVNLPDAGWIGEALSQAEQTLSLLDAFARSPLGYDNHEDDSEAQTITHHAVSPRQLRSAETITQPPMNTTEPVANR